MLGRYKIYRGRYPPGGPVVIHFWIDASCGLEVVMIPNPAETITVGKLADCCFWNAVSQPNPLGLMYSLEVIVLYASANRAA